MTLYSPRLGGWILLVFGFLAVVQALKYFVNVARESPAQTMGELITIAAEIIKERHPQFDEENQ